MGSRMAWRGVGSHRLVLATTILIVLLANAGPLAYMAVAGERGLRSLGPGFLTARSRSTSRCSASPTCGSSDRASSPLAISGSTAALLVHHVGIGMLVGVGVLVVSALIQTALRALGVQQTQLPGLQCVREFPLSGFLALLLAGGVWRRSPRSSTFEASSSGATVGRAARSWRTA